MGASLLAFSRMAINQGFKEYEAVRLAGAKPLKGLHRPLKCLMPFQDLRKTKSKALKGPLWPLQVLTKPLEAFMRPLKAL